MKIFTNENDRTKLDAPFWPDGRGSGGKLVTVLKRLSLFLLLMFSVNSVNAIGFDVAIDNVFQSHPTGCDNMDGSFNIVASGGGGTYEYSIDNGVSWQDAALFTGLGDNLVYNVLVRDKANTVDVIAWVNNPASMYNIDAIYSQNEYTVAASCFGAADGKANFEADFSHSGGTPPYAYTISGPTVNTTGATNGYFTDLEAGDYTITATNGSCSYTTAVLTVDEANEILIGESVTHVTCNDLTDGAIDITATDGVGAYDYDWTGPNGFTSTDEDLSGLEGGDYTVVVTDANSCSSTAIITVDNPIALSITTVTPSNSTCFDSNDGTILVVATGGTGDITYTINNGADISNITGDFSGLDDGSYNLTLVDANGCSLTYASNPIVLTEPALFEITDVVSTDVGCNGGADGEIVITATGGTTDYSYSIGGASQPSNTFSGLSAADYTVTAVDANSCSATWASNDVTIDEPTVITISLVDVTNVSNTGCFGDATGAIEITATGGTAPLSYSIDDGTSYQASSSFTGLVAGTYGIKVKDANDCELSDGDHDIDQPTQISIGAFGPSVDPSCFGGSDGEVHFTFTGGTGTLEYTISAGPDAGTGQATGDFTGLSEGTYTVLVEDDNGCSVTSNAATLTDPAEVTFTVDITDVDCKSNATGSIEVTATGGNSSYMYSNDDGSSWQTSNVFNTLVAGDYDIKVKDGNDCMSSMSTETVSEPALDLAVSNDSQTNVLCFGASTGAISVSASGGTADYTYLWSNSETTADITGLAAGGYSVLVTDANGCSVSDSWTITEPASAVSVTLSSSTMVDCNGNANGALTALGAGGTIASDYSYSWSNGATTAGITGLLAGNYTVIVTDDNSCTTSGTYTVTEPVELDFTSTVTDVSCNGLSNGEILVSATGGTVAYEYRIKLQSETTWTQPWQPSSTFSGLVSESYRVRVRDANGCTITKTVAVDEPDVLEITSAIETDISCFGEVDGEIDITLAGGTEAYTYAWSTGDVSEDLSGLSAGSYSVTVTDANGCTTTGGPYTIDEPIAIDFTFTTTDVDCNGNGNGEIVVAATGGTGAYEYRIKLQSGTWDEAWQSTNTFSNLDGEVYRVRVQDANGCNTTKTVTINEPDVLSASAIPSDVTCNGDADGAVDLSVSGGTTNYTFLWSNGATTEDLSGLSGGNFSVTVTDANGCTTTSGPHSVSEPSVLAVMGTETNILCFGESTGAIDVTTSGGTTDYTYLWSNAATTEDISSVIAGPYTITVTDANGCSTSDSWTITEPASALSISLTSSTDITCNGDANGIVDIEVTGGTTSYTYAWSNGATTQDISSLSGGSYTVTVTDANGCTETGGPYVVNEPDALSASATSVLDVTCNGDADGAVDLSVSGGTTNYTFLWSNGATTEDLSGLSGGNFSVTVTDANGCTTTSGPHSVSEPSVLAV
ncbi:SprB repeat-containing protein, partial [Lentimicrobium sp. S6]|uniref:beta strand repeat-containing protein n=1 Tax=Lentimicrobium sp. S6 TaxID=2735872 RepID=UPI0015531B9A